MPGDFGDNSGDGTSRHDWAGTVDPLAPSVANGQITPEQWEAYQRKRRRDAILGYLGVFGAATGLGAIGAAVGAGTGVAAASVPGATAGAPITAASQAAGMGLGAPSVAGLATSAAPTAAATGTGFWGGVTAPTFGAGTGAGGTATAAGTAASTGGTMAGISKGQIAFEAVSSFIRDFLGSKGARNNEKARAEAERLLAELNNAHEMGMLDKKLLADQSMADPFRHSLDQIGAAERMDRLATIDPLQMTPGGRQIGRYSVPSFTGGASNYAASPELRAAAAASRSAVLRGEGQAPSVVGGPDPMASTRPNPRTGVMDLLAAANQGRSPVSSTMPVKGPSLGNTGVFGDMSGATFEPVPVGAPSSVVSPSPWTKFNPPPAPVNPMTGRPYGDFEIVDPNALRMSIEDLVAAPSAPRPMARRRRLPAAQPMR